MFCSALCIAVCFAVMRSRLPGFIVFYCVVLLRFVVLASSCFVLSFYAMHCGAHFLVPFWCFILSYVLLSWVWLCVPIWSAILSRDALCCIPMHHTARRHIVLLSRIVPLLLLHEHVLMSLAVLSCVALYCVVVHTLLIFMVFYHVALFLLFSPFTVCYVTFVCFAIRSLSSVVLFCFAYCDASLCVALCFVSNCVLPCGIGLISTLLHVVLVRFVLYCHAAQCVVLLCHVVLCYAWLSCFLYCILVCCNLLCVCCTLPRCSILVCATLCCFEIRFVGSGHTPVSYALSL